MASQASAPNSLSKAGALTNSDVSVVGNIEEKGITTTESEASKEISSADIPRPHSEDGLVAWSQVFIAHLVSFGVWGYITSFGLFQAYYTQTLGKSPSEISWVGTLQIFLTFGLGTFSGHAYDIGHYRSIVATGLALQLVGVFTTSLCTSYWQLLLAQGICQGIGNGLVFCPTVNLVSSYFVRRRALTLAIMASGMSTGGIVFPLIARQLLGSLGFAWTVRVMGFVLLANAAIVLSLARPHPPKGLQGKVVEFTAFKDPSYTLFGAGMLLAVLGMYFAYYYIVTFAEDIIHVSKSTSFDLLIVTNAIGLPGRILPAQLADRWLGPINTLILVITISGLLTFCWAAVTNLAGTWGFAIVYGFFGASVQSMFPPAVASLTSDKSKVHDRVSLMFSILSLGSLCGAPIAGALIESDGGLYFSAQMFVGAIMLVSAITLIIAKCVQFRTSGIWDRV